MLLKKAIVLLSGGLDSAVCLGLAREQGYQCYTLSIDYQQRHRIELEYAARIAQQFAVAEHRVCQLTLGNWGCSLLVGPQSSTSHFPINEQTVTYVPARNTIFLSMALAWAEVIGANDIFVGANQDDYSNYPDCRPEYFAAFATMAILATQAGVNGGRFQIQAPLIAMNKVEIMVAAMRLGIELDATFSCYNPNANAQACLECPSCQLRSQSLNQLNQR